MDEIYVKLKESKSAAKVATRGKLKLDSAAEKRLHLLTSLKVKLAEAQYSLADESRQRAGLEKIQQLQLEINCERKFGRQGGSSK